MNGTGSERRSWVPMVAIAAAQIMMSSNISALPILIGGIVKDLDTAATTVGTAIVAYSLCVAGTIMLGAKLGSRWGSRTVFALGATGFAGMMAMVAVSRSAVTLVAAQGLAGLAAALLVPTLVVIARHYQGRQRDQAVGLLLAAHALGGVLALAIAGYLGAVASWRYPYFMLAGLGGLVVVASFRLKAVEPDRRVRIDPIGVLLSATGVLAISVGFNSINAWGLFAAKPGARFALGGISPALPLVGLGVALLFAFVLWSRKRTREGRTPLLDGRVVDARFKRLAVLCLFSIVAIDAAITFLVPLYIQIVQGRTSLQTSVAVVPYSLAIFIASILVVRLYDRAPLRRIAQIAFGLVAAGLVLLALVIANQWETPAVIGALLVVGLAQGALLTLLFGILLTSSPPRYAGDVGSLRGVTNNMAVGLGTAIAGALAVGLLAATAGRALVEHPAIPPKLVSQINLDRADFVGNTFLRALLEKEGATPAQIDARST